MAARLFRLTVSQQVDMADNDKTGSESDDHSSSPEVANDQEGAELYTEIFLLQEHDEQHLRDLLTEGLSDPMTSLESTVETELPRRKHPSDTSVAASTAGVRARKAVREQWTTERLPRATERQPRATERQPTCVCLDDAFPAAERPAAERPAAERPAAERPAANRPIPPAPANVRFFKFWVPQWPSDESKSDRLIIPCNR